MAIGPVQLLVLGFPQPWAHGEIADELGRLRDKEMVRAAGALVVAGDAADEAAALTASQLSRDQAASGPLAGTGPPPHVLPRGAVRHTARGARAPANASERAKDVLRSGDGRGT